jgi:hypothetical protein
MPFYFYFLIALVIFNQLLLAYLFFVIDANIAKSVKTSRADYKILLDYLYALKGFSLEHKIDKNS